MFGRLISFAINLALITFIVAADGSAKGPCTSTSASGTAQCQHAAGAAQDVGGMGLLQAVRGLATKVAANSTSITETLAAGADSDQEHYAKTKSVIQKSHSEQKHEQVSDANFSSRNRKIANGTLPAPFMQLAQLWAATTSRHSSDSQSVVLIILLPTILVLVAMLAAAYAYKHYEMQKERDGPATLVTRARTEFGKQPGYKHSNSPMGRGGYDPADVHHARTARTSDLNGDPLLRHSRAALGRQSRDNSGFSDDPIHQKSGRSSVHEQHRSERSDPRLNVSSPKKVASPLAAPPTPRTPRTMSREQSETLCPDLVVPTGIECSLLAPRLDLLRSLREPEVFAIEDESGGQVFSVTCGMDDEQHRQAAANNHPIGICLTLASPGGDVYASAKESFHSGISDLEVHDRLNKPFGRLTKSSPGNDRSVQYSFVTLSTGYTIVFHSGENNSFSITTADGKLLATMEPPTASIDGEEVDTASSVVAIGPTVDVGLIVLCLMGMNRLQREEAYRRQDRPQRWSNSR